MIQHKPQEVRVKEAVPRNTLAQLSSLYRTSRGQQANPRVTTLLARTTLDLKCTNCGLSFKKTFEERRRTLAYNQGEMVKLDNACPNKCGSQWFSVQEQHSIRKFKRHY